MDRERERRRTADRALVIGLCAVAFGVVGAELAAWTCDDAFISIRYARNLVAGNGLVFNPGERVEGFTNPAWTLLLALGLGLGIDARIWAVQLGVLAFGIALLLLVLDHRRRLCAGAEVTVVPIAAMVGALCFDWTTYATSGLETSMVTTLALAGFLALGRDLDRRRRRGWPPAAWLGLAVLTRPDAGVLAAAAAVPYLLGSRRRALGAYLAALAACVGPGVIATWIYYGSPIPNTYWAKSATTAWWDQGFAYLGLYLEQYWALLLGLPLAGFFAWKRRRDEPAWSLEVLGLALAVILYATAVVRVGGDFMYARLFVPLTPLLALLLARGVVAAWPGRTLVHALATLAVGGATQLSPRPVGPLQWPHGVADEWAVYDPERAAEADADGRRLREVVAGLDVRIAFLGGMARVIDAARAPWAVDAETGLTDPGIAHRPLPERGRPGHEKRATVDELLARRVHIVIGHDASRVLHLRETIPLVPVWLGTIEGFAIHWDPEVFETMRARGMTIRDFPRGLDDTIARLPTLDDARALAVFRRVQRFYFDWVDDPLRRAPFEARFPREAAAWDRR